MSIPPLLPISTLKEAHVTAPFRNRGYHVWVGHTLINWTAIDWHNRVILRMYYKGWHLYFVHFLQTAGLMVVLCTAWELTVHFTREFFIKITPGLNFLEHIHIQVEFIYHLGVNGFFFLVLRLSNYKIFL